ncbi:unnamed protein product [Polarella glacialis]|uniref:Uncharacterized protein n=1 Tax=Polarella glacialis TaxID=89957 RepID=A0A813LZD0_POLGL|nr:unnamed protein product [Polarella glacialis]
MVKGFIEDMTFELKTRDPKETKKALPLLTAMVCAWEVMVMNEGETWYLRLLAWVRLLRVWAAFRSSDLSGISPSSLRMGDGHLEGIISISKTTGVGKKVAKLAWFVSKEAWLLKDIWLVTGYELFKADAGARSFLLPLPTPNLDSFTAAEPGYAQACAANRKLLSMTKCVGSTTCPSTLECEIAQGAEPLLLPGVQQFWSEHGDRATVTSWADRISRWRPEASEEYVRNSRSLALGAESAGNDCEGNPECRRG